MTCINNNKLTVLDVIATVLEKLTQDKATRINKDSFTIFHAIQPPNISIKDYLVRIAKYSNCNETIFILSLIYIDRLMQNNPSYSLDILNIHRYIIASSIVATKYINDFFYSNNHYARIGGVSIEELNALEIEFLNLIKFDLYISDELYQQYYNGLSNTNPKNVKCNKPKKNFTKKTNLKNKIQNNEHSVPLNNNNNDVYISSHSSYESVAFEISCDC
eukprot:TRINITY_DN1571_c0_g1_i1.p1 TRINITY_DN1571_c0_g1~~TRINITY_DN1571_c0_g1_i1.p1  ORF type:complete len:245 (+),score=27.00 TRINITY_DN1571_c0_g1_i1:83-736(+)